MRLTDALLAFAAAQAVSAGPTGPVRSLTDKEILETMLQRPWIFPPGSTCHTVFILGGS
jgi:hypothetical protein